jgi:hypothetical protein
MTVARHSGRLMSVGGFLLAASFSACAPMRSPQPAPAPAPAPLVIADLPPIPVQTLVGDTPVRPVTPDRSQRITLNSSNADLRDLLPLLANAAGVNLVMGPEVRGRVSVRFQNVKAIDALNAVIDQAGLIVGDAALEAPWGKPVFYDLPVNVNLASAPTIRARFDVTQRLADWVVKGRTF